MRLFILILTLSIAGCVNTIPTYSQSEIKEKRLSLVKSRNTDASFLSKEKLAALIDAVYKPDGTAVFSKAMFAGPLGEIYLEPGQYIFVIKCQTGDAFAMPRIRVGIEPEKSYVLFCESVTTGTLLGIPTQSEAHAHIEEANETNTQHPKQ